MWVRCSRSRSNRRRAHHLGDKLRAAADVYDKQDHEAGGALDSFSPLRLISPALFSPVGR